MNEEVHDIPPDVMHLLFEKGMFLGAFTNAESAIRTMKAREANGKGPIVHSTYHRKGQEINVPELRKKIEAVYYRISRRC